MYMRLWWKEARQFWPIWIFLMLGAATGEWIALKYYSPFVRQGMLGYMALIWTGVYAVAVGAAAFAAERETGTLRLLDILPVGRPVVWAGKVSFALLTTLVLAALLLAMAMIGTDRWDRWGTEHFGPEGNLTPWLAVCYGLAVLMTLTWGLFWSSILSNALTAALVAACSTAVSTIFVLTGISARFMLANSPWNLERHDENAYLFAILEIAVILVTLAASNLFFTRTSRRRRLPFQFQSPIVLTPVDRVQPRRIQLQSPVTATLATGKSLQTASGRAQASASDQSPRRSWLTEASALVWETRYQSATTWALLAVIGLALPLPFYLSAGYLDPSPMMLIDIMIALVAGINVFGMENRGRTQRFLTHHGARPGTVWLVKLTVWCLGLALIWVPQAIVMYNAQPSPPSLAQRDNVLQAILIVPLFFTVAVLCGMVISRGLTAAVIAVVMTLALAVPQYMLIAVQLLPVAGLLVIPVGLLAISWAWSGDWLLDRPAPRQWLSLGSLLAGMFTVVLSFYVGFRVWSVPDIGPIAPPRAWIAAESVPLSPDRNAADLYREAFQAMKGHYPNNAESLDQYRQALDLVKQAAARPDYRINQTALLTLASPNPYDVGMINNLARLVILDARDRLVHQDLAGSWTALITLFRMVRHMADGAPIAPAMNALKIEREVLDLAMEWTIAPRQTSEQLRSALAAFRDLPTITPPDENLRAEANFTERTLELPTKEIKELVESVINGPDRASVGSWPAPWVDWLITPWERARARRVNRLLANSAIQKVALGPSQRSSKPQTWDTDYFQSTPLARILVANEDTLLVNSDWNEAGRRAMIQLLAIRDWQLKHNGQFPESLEKLVPEELPSLPLDPYSGRNFSYRRSEGQSLIPLGRVLNGHQEAGQISTTGYWLLSSVGHAKRHNDVVNSRLSDFVASPFRTIVFPIPPVKNEAGVDKNR